MDASQFQDELDKRESEKKTQDSNEAEVHAINKAGIKNVEATNTNTRATIEGAKAIKAGVKVTNPDLAKTADLKEVTDAIHKSNLTAYMANKGLPELADNLSTLNQRTQDLQDKVADEGLARVAKALDSAVKQLTTLSKSTGSAQVTVDKKLQSTIDNLTKQIGKIDFNPSVNVSAPDTKVITTPVDFAPILKSLQAVQNAIEDKETPDNRPDLDPVISGLNAVQTAITSLRFPVPNYVLPFKDINGKDVQVQLDASGNVPTSGGGGGGGGTQYTDGAAAVTHPIGTQQVFTNGSSIVTAVSTANPLPVSATFSGSVTSSPTFAQNPAAGSPTPAFGLIDSSFRPQVSVATALPAGTNVIGHVITDTGSTTAVTGTVGVTQSTSPWIVAGGGTAGTPGTAVLTVQGVGSGTAIPVSGTFFQATQPVSLATNTPTLQSGSTTAVTQATASNLNATVVGTGTFVTQATLAAETTKVIGTVNQGTSPWVVSGTVTANAGTNLNTSALATSANQTNATQKTQLVDGSGNVIASTSNALNVAITSGGGSGGTSSSFGATFPATGTAIGAKNGTNMVNLVADASGNLDVNLQTAIPAGTNVIGHVIADSGSTTAVTQATASNLNATAVQGTAAALTGGWPTINGEAGDVTGTFTNATQTTSVTASNLDGYGNTLISINGTYGTATAIFEGSDDSGTTWYTVQAARDNTNVIETGYTSLTNTSQTWQVNNPGFDSLRVRSTAVTSGTVNVRLSSSAAPVASGTIVGLGTSIPAGSNAIGSITNTSFIATQATGTNLHAVTDSGSVVAATLSAETTKVIGTVNQGTSPWVISGNLTNISGTISLPTGAATSANQSTEITSLGTIAALSKAEDSASGSGDTGIMALGVRNDTVADSTNTNGDYTQLSTDVKGHILTADAPRLLKGRQVTTITSSTAETTIVTAVTSTFLDIYRLVITNTSATACTVTIKDSTAGTTVWVWEVPAGDSRGMAGPMDAAANQSTINNNWTATCGTSVASIVVSAEYVKNI